MYQQWWQNCLSDDPCPSTTRASTVVIDAVDPEIVRNAQQKLAERLRQSAEIEAIESHEELFQREIEALERSAQADEVRANAELLRAEDQFNEPQYNSEIYYPFYPNRFRHNGDIYNDRLRNRRDRRSYREYAKPKRPIARPPIRNKPKT